MKNLKFLSVLLLMLVLASGCGSNGETETTETPETTDTEKTAIKQGAEIEVSDVNSIIIENTDENIVIDPAEDTILEEDDSDISVTATFFDSNGDGIIHGKSNEKIFMNVTLTNNGKKDYVISQMDSITYSDSVAFVSADDTLSEDGFVKDSTNMNYNNSFTLPAGASLSFTLSRLADHEIYSNEQKVLSLSFVADTEEEDTKDIFYEYKYTIVGAESNGETFEVEAEPEAKADPNNIATVTEEIFVENTNGDNTIGGEGDNQFSGSQGREASSLDPQLVVKDSSGDGKLDFGEKSHVTFSLTNNSDSTYTIKRFEMSVDTYYGGKATNLKLDNAGALVLEIDENGRISDPEGGFSEEFDLAAGDTMSIDFDYTITPEDDHGDYLDNETSNHFISADFIGEQGTKLYSYKLDKESLNFSHVIE